MFNKIKNIKLHENYSLKNLSTFHIGGDALYYIECYTLKSIKQVLDLCLKINLKYKIIGNGSNLLFDNKGFNGVIIRYCNQFVKVQKNVIIASSGLELSSLINIAKQHSLSGLENYVGIPCSLGGAVKNNLGCFDKEISNNIFKIKYLKLKQKNIFHLINNKLNIKYKNNIINLIKINKSRHNTKNKYYFKYINIIKIINNKDFSYRKCNFINQKDFIYLIYLKLNKTNKNNIIENIKNYYHKKSSSQPLNTYNAGSIFKRNGEIIPAKLIDDLGLKGTKIGDAEISTKHSGFIINNGKASAQDVIELINIIKNKIKNIYGYELETELEYVPY